VLLVKNNLKACTLAIGDGANDVSMIQQAHVGVGISGHEGMQAVMSSDYAISQFRFLQYLLLVHGRYSYKRISKLILYCFYKNMTFSISQFPMMCVNGFSGQTMYDGWTTTFYNIIFTGLPILIYAIFEKDVLQRSVLANPQLYESGLKNQEFSIGLLAYWLGTAVYQGMVLYFFNYFAVLGYDYHMGVGVDGSQAGLWAFGAHCWAGLILIVGLRLAIEVRNWNGLMAFALIGSTVCFFAWQLIISSFVYFATDGSMFWVPETIYGAAQFWLVLLLVWTTASFPIISIEYIQRNYFYKNYQIIQEVENLERNRKLLQVRSEIQLNTVQKTSAPEEFAVKKDLGNRGSKRFTGYAFSPEMFANETLQFEFLNQNTDRKNTNYGFPEFNKPPDV